MLRLARDAAINFALKSTDIAGAGHGRTGASDAWLQHGIASVPLPSEVPACTANPTLYQQIDKEWKFLDIQVISNNGSQAMTSMFFSNYFCRKCGA